MTNKSKIRESKQEWKLYVSFFGFIMAGGVMLYGIKQTTAGTEAAVDLILYSLVTEIIIGVFACVSIRCPECKLKWVWHAVSKKDANQWVPWLLSFEECPQCVGGTKRKGLEMPLRKRDLVFVAVAGGLLLLLGLNTLRDKPKSPPDTDRHRPFRAALAMGEKRESVEKGCVSCHNAATRPLPPEHPPKEQCLICHPFPQAH